VISVCGWIHDPTARQVKDLEARATAQEPHIKELAALTQVDLQRSP
jgi:hypothetical protein